VKASPYFAAWRAQAYRYEAAYRLLDELDDAFVQHMHHERNASSAPSEGS
jgi:hypothetical protein